MFSTQGEESPWRAANDLRTTLVPLRQNNVMQAMMATGAIPYVLEGVRDIPGAPRGLYWDGGMTDYHFYMDFHAGYGLVLYPHFSPEVIPGWFDKPLSWRQVHAHHFDLVVLVTPSK